MTIMAPTHTIDLTDVRRVENPRGSHIEPPLDQSWSPLDKLRWNARVVEIDSDLPIGTFDIRDVGDGLFAMLTPGVGGMHETYSAVWQRLVMTGAGARLARRMDAEATK